MRFLAVAALSVAMTTAFGQTGTQGTQSTDGSSGSGVYQQDKTQQDRTQSGQGTRQDDRTQSGQGSQGMGAGSAEARVRSEVQWMKSEFNLTDQQEQRVHDVLLKYESQSTTTGADVSKLKDEKEKELKAIIGDDNYKIYKEKKKDKDKDDTRSGSGAVPQNR